MLPRFLLVVIQTLRDTPQRQEDDVFQCQSSIHQNAAPHCRAQSMINHVGLAGRFVPSPKGSVEYGNEEKGTHILKPLQAFRQYSVAGFNSLRFQVTQ